MINDAPKFGFGSAPREKNYFNSYHTLPGPDHYNSSNLIGRDAPSQSMPGRRKDLRAKSGVGVPGAGSYNPSLNYVKKNAPGYSVNRSSRDGPLGQYGRSPILTKYTPNYKLAKTHSASWVMGSEKRPKEFAYVPPTPGPGAHKHKSHAADGPKYHISTRNDHIPKDSPGPGSYNHKKTGGAKAAPEFSVGKQERVTIKELNGNPGPGNYG